VLLAEALVKMHVVWVVASSLECRSRRNSRCKRFAHELNPRSSKFRLEHVEHIIAIQE
jgi:hypothetical protein